jgi:MFS family permease
LPTALRAFESRNFRIYWTGFLLSLIGTWMQNTAQSWLVYRLTKSEFYLGLASFSGALPVLLLSPLAGWLADRYPRRTIVMVTQAGALIQAAVLAGLTLTGNVRVEMVLAMAFLLGCFNAFDIPARQSLAPALIQDREGLLNAISLNAIAFQCARFVGPAMAGLVIARFGEGYCFLANAVSFLALLANLSRLRLDEDTTERPAKTPVLESVREGFAYVRARPEIARMIENSAWMSIATSSLFTLAPALAAGVFQQNASGYGLFQSALSVGALVSLARLASRKASGPEAMVAIVAGNGLFAAACYFGLALAPAFLMAIAVMPFVGFTLTRQNAVTNTYLQSTVEETYRGRVMSLFTMSVMGMIPVGSMLAGSVASQWGPRVGLALAGMVAVGASLRFRYRTSKRSE